MADKDPTESAASTETEQEHARREFAYLSLPQSQRLVWTAVLGSAFTLITWFAWTRTAPPGPLPAPYSWARFWRPFELNREFRPPGAAPSLYTASFADDRHGWVVGKGVTIRTADGGQTWQSLASPSGSLRSAHFIDARRGWAVGYDGTILATRDGGASWSSQSHGEPVNLFSVYFVNAQRGWAVGGSGAILATEDGGANWNVQRGDFSSDLLSVQFVDAQHGWVVGDLHRILATTDGGQTWQSLTSPSGSLRSVHFIDASRGWAVGDGGTILATSDGGASWSSQSYGQPVDLFSVQFVDA
jgi:photosystem II stability/assembly factor-like uncharacterized protein